MKPDALLRFRLISCQLDELRKCKCPTKAKVEKILDDLPEELDGMYDRILGNIHQIDREDVLKILQWIMFSLRPMTVRELGAILAFDSGEAEDLPEDESVMAMCSGLVVIHTRSPKSSAEVHLAHKSVQEYLVRKYGSQHFDVNAAHLSIAKTCLAYLLQFNELESMDSDTLLRRPLAKFAARYWTAHLVVGGPPLDYDEWADCVHNLNQCFDVWVTLVVGEDMHRNLYAVARSVKVTCFFHGVAKH